MADTEDLTLCPECETKLERTNVTEPVGDKSGTIRRLWRCPGPEALGKLNHVRWVEESLPPSTEVRK